MKIVINAGHGKLNSGGYDPGAIGQTGLQEATVTKRVAERVVRKLTERGVEAPFIQDGDLWDVSEFSNAQKADAFVSIHCDSVESTSAHGIETFCYKFGGTGEKIARAVQSALIETTGLTDRGVKEGNLHVLRETTDTPAILTEIGFISNLSEEALMNNDEWDEKVAEAIVKGLAEVFSMSEKPVENQPEKKIAEDDIYLSVRVREKYADGLIEKIKTMGYACKRMDLA